MKRQVHPHPDLSPSGERGEEPVVIAVDVARFGSDKSVILVRRGLVVEDLRSYRGLDTMKLVGRVVATAVETHGSLRQKGVGAAYISAVGHLQVRVATVPVADDGEAVCAYGQRGELPYFQAVSGGGVRDAGACQVGAMGHLNPNPPKDTDGRREGSGRGWVRELQGRWPGLLG